ncbi:MAG: hypothetical protein WAN51_01675 [Alphaproteobacteria bacterium]
MEPDENLKTAIDHEAILKEIEVLANEADKVRAASKTELPDYGDYIPEAKKRISGYKTAMKTMREKFGWSLDQADEDGGALLKLLKERSRYQKIGAGTIYRAAIRQLEKASDQLVVHTGRYHQPKKGE